MWKGLDATPFGCNPFGVDPGDFFGGPDDDDFLGGGRGAGWNALVI